MTNLINHYVDNHIGYIELNVPEKRNALSLELMQAVIAQLQAFDEQSDVRVIILSGSGKAFCAGGDISSFEGQKSMDELIEWMKNASKLTKTILNLNKFVISAIHGFAAGAGFSLALASDFIIANQEAKFICSFSNIGLVPDLGLSKLLADRVPVNIAKQWIVTAQPISMEEAMMRGVINDVTDGDVVEAATQFAQKIVDGPPMANKFVKYLVNNAQSVSHEVSIMQENMIQSILLQSIDNKEGITAFFEKRKPQFIGQ